MTIDWQDAAVGLIVLAACGYLAYRTWRVWSARRQSACGGCGDCSSRPARGNDGFVPLEKLSSD